MIEFPRISSDKKNVTIKFNDEKKFFELATLPSSFIGWQVEERTQMFNYLLQGKKPVFLAPHLPTLITISEKKTDFGMNAASKGIGLVPADKEIYNITQQFQELMHEINNTDYHSSLKKRFDAAMLFYGNQKIINRHCLGGLEIFESQSFSNLKSDPRVSLFFVGGAPSYKSFQINCIAEVIDNDNIFYDFVSSMRALFEQADFHYQQPKYPYAIKYHVIEVFDKSLKVRGR